MARHVIRDFARRGPEIAIERSGLLELPKQLVRIDHRGGKFLDLVAGDSRGYSRRIVSEQVGLIAAIL